MISQGDLVWVDFLRSGESAPAGRRPALVIQTDRFNGTGIGTVVVVAVTSKLKYAQLPGNVRLNRGEAGLPRPSVVNVTQVGTIDRTDIVGRLGRLSQSRLREVWAGLCLVMEPE